MCKTQESQQQKQNITNIEAKGAVFSLHEGQHCWYLLVFVATFSSSKMVPKKKNTSRRWDRSISSQQLMAGIWTSNENDLIWTRYILFQTHHISLHISIFPKPELRARILTTAPPRPWNGKPQLRAFGGDSLTKPFGLRCFTMFCDQTSSGI